MRGPALEADAIKVQSQAGSAFERVGGQAGRRVRPTCPSRPPSVCALYSYIQHSTRGPLRPWRLSDKLAILSSACLLAPRRPRRPRPTHSVCSIMRVSESQTQTQRLRLRLKLKLS